MVPRRCLSAWSYWWQKWSAQLANGELAQCRQHAAQRPADHIRAPSTMYTLYPPTSGYLATYLDWRRASTGLGWAGLLGYC